ncbi:MAG: GNAT family N-acetyltransferase [Ferruginibacter sp.]
MIQYLNASTATEYSEVKALFEAYAQSININLGFQKFDEELNALDKMYCLPFGGIILGKDDNEYIGCVGIRKITPENGELKRMYVKPSHQKMGIGKILLQKALVLAKDCKYEKLQLDTLNYMIPAINLYKKNGFYEIPAYYFNPISTAVYFEKLL